MNCLTFRSRHQNNEKKHIEQLHARDDEISRLNKELDLLKLKDQMIAKNQSYLEAKAQKDVNQIKELLLSIDYVRID